MKISKFIKLIIILCISLILISGCTSSVGQKIPSTTNISPTTSPSNSSEDSVGFTLDPGTPENCGLTCRQTTATITNTGSETTHNVCVELSVSNSKGERIFLNNRLTIQRCIGDLASGQSKTEPITINADCGAFGTKCIGLTLILKCRVTSDEKSGQFPDSVISI